MKSSAWIKQFHPKGDAEDLVVCFPHAAGSAGYYFPLSAAMPPSIDMLTIQYPGRQDRRDEPLIDSVDELADQIAEVVMGWSHKPMTLFGHSMGASVAFEVALRLETKGITLTSLVVSGRRAPSTRRVERSHLGSDTMLIADLRKLGGMPEQLLDDEEFVRMLLPVLRNDLRAAETYEPQSGGGLRSPILALAGDSDPKVSVHEVKAWETHTRGSFEFRMMPGGHFPSGDEHVAIAGLISEQIMSTMVPW
ncbi:thioesterase II family protein [Amycolatopsis sp. lyj-90]|uniref:thioesterase II family protein n=1 Tax=Amycolatopsis sp. lyj-90 TaxID=2789285 RepID=UPI00397D8A32